MLIIILYHIILYHTIATRRLPLGDPTVGFPFSDPPSGAQCGVVYYSKACSEDHDCQDSEGTFSLLGFSICM